MGVCVWPGGSGGVACNMHNVFPLICFCTAHLFIFYLSSAASAASACCFRRFSFAFFMRGLVGKGRGQGQGG